MPKQCVKINVGKGYDVIIGSSLLNSCGEMIKSVSDVCRTAVITDSNVEKLYLDKVTKSLETAGFEVITFSFAAGEESKNISTLADILEFLAENNFSRSDMLIALGGGVVGDITGFAAATFLRGVRYIQLPTTLLAAVDSSVGGKTAIDLRAGKNLAGAFCQPEIVICDIDTFDTLPKAELSNGVAESVKYGVLFDEELFDAFAELDISSLTEDKERLINIIAKCVAHKGRVVENDEFDRGERRLLNLGHTIGHAIEKCSSFTVPHGHAVAAGTAMIARAGEAKGITPLGTASKISNMLKKYDLPTNTSFSTDELLSVTLTDKKRTGKTIGLAVIDSIGNCSIKTEPVEALKEYISLSKGE